MKKQTTKQMIITALCIAMGLILPMAFHSIPNAGKIFLPMHIPVLICGLACGWQYGLICGVLTPFLSSILTGMPPIAYLPSMLCELAVYGLVSGILIHLIHTKKQYLDLYISLIIAMVAGRITMGMLNALIFQAGNYKFNLWITGAFVTALPGIIIQLLIIPTIIFALKKSNLIERD
ncbi:MAG: ECF transporter S component [Cellulosilyticaceae bacterium]